MRIKDSTALGAVAGLVATIPQLIFDTAAFWLGFTNYYAFQISGSIYLMKDLTDTVTGLLLGGIVWEAMAILLGVATVFYIRYTGSDYWWLKGLLVSNVLMYTIMYGFLYNIGGAQIVPLDINTNITILLGNVIFGITAAYFIVRWEDRPLLKSGG